MQVLGKQTQAQVQEISRKEKAICENEWIESSCEHDEINKIREWAMQ